MNALAGTPLTVVIRQVSANVTVWHVVAQFRAASIGVDVYTWTFEAKNSQKRQLFQLVVLGTVVISSLGLDVLDDSKTAIAAWRRPGLIKRIH